MVILFWNSECRSACSLSLQFLEYCELHNSFQKLLKNVVSPESNPCPTSMAIANTLNFRFSVELLCYSCKPPELAYIHRCLNLFMCLSARLPVCPSFISLWKKSSLTLQRQGGKVAAYPQVTGSCKTLILPLLGYWTGHQCSKSEAQQGSLTWSMKHTAVMFLQIIFLKRL